MPLSLTRLGAACLLLLAACLLAGPARAQAGTNNDGFRRRNGLMEVIRNGRPYPMTRDAHLPTGATVTKDGFVVGPDGRRSELPEGQGCDLRGRPVAVLAGSGGTLALAAAGEAAAEPAAMPASGLLQQVFGSEEEGGIFHFKKGKKHHGKGQSKGHGYDD